MKILKTFVLVLILACASVKGTSAKEHEIPFAEGKLQLTPMQDNAVRVRYIEGETKELPEWIYVATENDVWSKESRDGNQNILILKEMKVVIDHTERTLSAYGKDGRLAFHATAHQLKQNSVQGEPTREAVLVMDSPDDEHLYGLGQFQDGYLNIKGLTRRLTQVNTQIAVPFLMSSKGYGILWNNYGLTDFNPADHKVEMTRSETKGEETLVNVTSTEGGRMERRRNNTYAATIEIPQDGRYSILLDVGQKMARRHNLSIDGQNFIDVRNLWLPPTTSMITELKAGVHEFTAELERGDSPVIYWKKVEDNTVFRSPVAECVDYTIFTGSADEIVAAYRTVTGEVPMLPSWALGYIHCRERFKSQDELLTTARKFREEQIPIDVIVQDWQYWGKYGWNAMKFDEEFYPDPAEMVDQLHGMDMRLMLSVWSKIDPSSDLGKEAQDKGLFIPETTWIDFFDQDAADFYWKNFSEKLLPIGIDAWWQDATEPENDDLEGRRIIKGTVAGERYRNVYPMMVNRTVYDGLRKDDPQRRAMILTRSGFSGIQRYGSVLWSGDVGNDWQTLRYQIAAGLGFTAAGLPWWTYDAGGFFRPGDQYTNAGYIERLIRWVQVGTFLPLMRVHGYMSDTEPWNYGDDAKRIITDFIRLRYRLMPYIYSEAAQVSLDGSTIMRPYIFDFPQDDEALMQEGSYMFGHSILVSPVLEAGASECKVYLPENEGGWYDWWTGEKTEGGQYVRAKVNIEKIPVYIKGGSIVPLGGEKQFVAQKTDDPVTVKIYPGADASFVLYEDEGDNYNYEDGAYSLIGMEWNEAQHTLTIAKREGSFVGMEAERIFVVDVQGQQKRVTYKGKKAVIKF